jgi:hypothetical protein
MKAAAARRLCVAMCRRHNRLTQNRIEQTDIDRHEMARAVSVLSNLVFDALTRDGVIKSNPPQLSSMQMGCRHLG